MTTATYLREVEIRFKAKKVGAKTPASKSITDSAQVYQLFKDLENESKEKLIAISLDTKLKIIAFEVISLGSLNALYARPAEAVRAAILVNAYGVIMVHNHPSGDPTPSDPDKTFTEKLARSCQDLGIALHDHVIIGENTHFSFAEEGLI